MDIYGNRRQHSYLSSIVICIFLLISCTKHYSSDITIGESKDRVRWSSFTDTVNIIPLQMDSLCQFGMIQKVIKTDDWYFVLDDSKRKLLKYNINGIVCGMINKVGNSSKEYHEILDYDADEKSQTIYMVCQPGKLMTFDFDLNMKSEMPLSEYCDRICFYGDKIYLYNNIQRILYWYDNGVLQKIHEEGLNLSDTESRSAVFHKQNDCLLYIAEYTNIVYKVCDTKLEQCFDFVYPDIESRMNADLIHTAMRTLKESRDKSPLLVRNILETDSLYVLVYSHELRSRYCTIDKNTKRVVSDGIIQDASPSPTSMSGKLWIAPYNPMGESSPVDSAFNKCNIVNEHLLNEMLPCIVEYIVGS